MPSTLSGMPQKNQLLAALPILDYLRLEPQLERVNLATGELVYESSDLLDFLYFPADCVVSLRATTQDGAASALAIVGNDGLIGISAVLGGERSAHQVVAQSSGQAYRLPIEAARRELDQRAELRSISLAYVQALMTQIEQGALCCRHHSADQQVCRWILLCMDQLPGVQLNLTQARLGEMAGLRRETVAAVMGSLQKAGILSYGRGQI